MQRLFSMFPSGVAGMGLIALRACVLESIWMALPFRPDALTSWPGACLAVTAVMIAIGLLTPILCALIVLIEGLSLFHHSLQGVRPTLLAMGLAGVLAVLGPGAFSVDSMLFARRRIFPGRQ